MGRIDDTLRVVDKAHINKKLQTAARSQATDMDSQSQPELLNVDPLRINLATQGLNSTKRPPEIRTALLSADPDLTLGGDWDNRGWGTSLAEVESMDVYRAMRDCLLLGQAWEETKFFQRVRRQINSGVPRWGCRTEAELLKRLSIDIERLFNDISTSGYKTQLELYTAAHQDEIRAGIRRDGRFVLFDGRHRLSIARLLKLSSVPVNVVVRHHEWITFKEEIRRYADEHLGGRVYQQLDHPDLADIPAKHGTERIGLILRGLESYNPHGKTLLDIGTHWGYMPQQMEKLGFHCTGIELNPVAASFARRLCIATESSYELWEGDLLEYPGGEVDVVLALSIFHHMIKTKKRHAQLEEMLARLSPEMMIFEPHDRESAAQMENAYRDYAPDEFVTFVSEHARLPNVEYLGTPTDRYKRPIFKLTR